MEAERGAVIPKLQKIDVRTQCPASQVSPQLFRDKCVQIYFRTEPRMGYLIIKDKDDRVICWCWGRPGQGCTLAWAHTCVSHTHTHTLAPTPTL